MDTTMRQEFERLAKEERAHLKGLWGEFHLNVELNRQLHALSYREETKHGNTFLFTRIHIPSWRDRQSGELHTTEIDSLLVCQKGIFAFEVKSWSGSAGLFGEKDGKQWYQVNARGQHGGNTTGNPFSQNRHHVKYLAQFLQSYGVSGYIKDAVMLIDADPLEVRTVKWQGEKIGNLFLGASDAAKWPLSLADVISGDKVRQVALTLARLSRH